MKKSPALLFLSACLVPALMSCAPDQAPITPTPTVVAAGPDLQEVDFIRGCWIQRDSYGLDTSLLRLLPGRDEPNRLEGYLQRVTRGGEIVLSLHYVFSRDGRSLVISGQREKLPGMRWRPKENSITYFYKPLPSEAPRAISDTAMRAAYIDNSEGWQVVEGEEERLALYALRDDGVAISLFDGQRDGCD